MLEIDTLITQLLNGDAELVSLGVPFLWASPSLPQGRVTFPYLSFNEESMEFSFNLEGNDPTRLRYKFMAVDEGISPIKVEQVVALVHSRLNNVGPFPLQNGHRFLRMYEQTRFGYTNRDEQGRTYQVKAAYYTVQVALSG